MWEWLIKLIGLELTQEEKMILEAAKKKQKHLDKYGGKNDYHERWWLSL